ncbi:MULTISPECIES: aldose 1-epimerase [unclassified Caballeronia]|uniref:aldose 1-epimerase n=1 Tax=unclassified Caballeronia TaxID=2646786 RepID=UPI00285F9369|nr:MULTISPECIES: aldose 1-epimerase [unclassified Caballeronia]MDR5816476.1 aldose 1-epimerase [Caballeronia sp. LZ033]MDR5881275.1 aldose 1-epimerase [Caballeronia sp. LZ032]
MSTPASARLVELRHEGRRVLLAPDIGGAIAAFDEFRDGRTVHWLRPATSEALAARDPLGMASFPLLPYCNRIRDARFVFQGAVVDLSGDGNAFPHALHGNAWRLPWRVDDFSDRRARLALRHEPSPEAAHHWPFAYEAAQDFTLDADSLSVTLSMRNLADRPMPFGMGHHPYYPRSVNTRIHARVRAMWHSTSDLLPTHAGAHPSVDAMASQEGMSADAFDLDNNYACWSRTAIVEWPDERRSVTLSADPRFAHMVVYAPAAYPDLLCVEPVSNVADWVNLFSVEHALKGGAVLMPGESACASFRWMTRFD